MAQVFPLISGVDPGTGAYTYSDTGIDSADLAAAVVRDRVVIAALLLSGVVQGQLSEAAFPMLADRALALADAIIAAA